MSLTAAFVFHELRTQARSLRFRTAAALYVLAGSLPAALVHVQRPTLDYVVGGPSYAFEVAGVLPLLTAAFAFLLSMDGITREQGEGAWTTVTLCEVSNAGYLLRRWLALQCVFLPLSALPFVAAAGIALADGITHLDPWAFAGTWLFQVAPLAMVMSALGLGVGTIGGGPLNALPLVGLLFGLVPPLLNQALHFFSMRFTHPLDWAGFQTATWTVGRTTTAMAGRERWGWMFPYPASEVGFDPQVMREQDFAAGALLAAMAAVCLGVATVYLRRTRPDVRPHRVRPGHPLRSFLRSWSRLRERYTPDPSPAPADRIAVALSLLLSIALFTALVARAGYYEDLANARYSTETMPAPFITPTAIVPGLWQVRARVGPGSGIAVEVSAEMINQGTEPAGQLSFELNSELAAEVSADEGQAVPSRSWDRMFLELEPPIPPGGRRRLRFHLSGEPAWMVFPSSRESGSFIGSYTEHFEAQFSRDRLDFSRSYREPSVSRSQVSLQGADLIPVPRYSPWTGPEGVFPPARVELSVSGPAGLFLADTCGSFVPASERAARLESRCRMALPDLAVVGGHHRLLQEEAPGGGMTVAVFPAHVQAAELHLGFLARSAGMLDEAWPGVGSAHLVVLEWPQQQVHARGGQSLAGWYREPEDSLLTVTGNLAFLQETDLIRLKGLQPESLAVEILSQRLAGRRRFAPEVNLFFRQFLRTLAMERMGLGPQNGAQVGPLHYYDENLVIQTAALDERPSYSYWRFRFPALVSALESRVGAEPLKQAVEELLARGEDPDAAPATAEELFAVIVRHSPSPAAVAAVEALIRDSFVAGDLPYPVLEGVEFRHAGAGWQVTGRMVNEGKGEAFCKVVLTTELGPESIALRAGTGESAGFALATRHRPQGVFLDPDRECHRLVRNGAPRDRVWFEGTR
ncbi:MAG TPA: hypothetical protein VNM67_16275 [Thermoanaerobaculia bacterium]|nr:hypothetical protein [Thermoanaerobaculia bacterium]